MRSKSYAASELSLTSDALAALQRSGLSVGLSRRAFLQGTGALIVGFSMGGVLGTVDAQAQGGVAPDSPPANEVDSWIAINSDSSVTAYTGKEEIGQGMSTAQTQLVAEELSVPFSRVTLIACDTAFTPDQGRHVGQPIPSREF
jgi:nicotinate dehydrogenase subunit B